MLRKTATRNEKTSAKDKLSESSPRTRMTADCEATRNSANGRIRMTGSSKSQEETTATIEGSSEDHMAADSGERNATDGKDLEQHFSHGERPAEVEGSRCCPTCHPV